MLKNHLEMMARMMKIELKKDQWTAAAHGHDEQLSPGEDVGAGVLSDISLLEDANSVGSEKLRAHCCATLLL